MYHIKQDKRSKQSAAFIFNSLSALLDEKSYEDIKVTEVIEKAQISRGTFYRNFDSLDDVLRYECDQKFISLKKYVYEYHKTKSNNSSYHPLELLTPFLRFWYLDSTIIELLIKVHRQEILMDNISTILIDNLRIESSKINNDPLFSYWIKLRTSIISGILENWITENKNIAPDELSKKIMNHLIESMFLKFEL